MKKYILSGLFIAGLASLGFAQRTAQPSPSSSIKQTVGVTDFTISYSRPSLKGRTAFGPSSELAPLGTLWRTGANQATTLESTTDFKFGGTDVPAGKYALFSIPDNGSWTVILNKNYQGNVYAYKESDDVARVKVSPKTSTSTETFTIGFDDLTDSTANIGLSWATTSIPVSIGVATSALTYEGMKKAVAEKPEDAGTLQSAATFMLNKGIDLDQALAIADKSIGLKETFGNLWLKAQILGKLGKIGDAVKISEKALAVGEASGGDAFKNQMKGQIEKGLATFKSQLPVPATNLKKGKKK